jgi:hypothetical protein
MNVMVEGITTELNNEGPLNILNMLPPITVRPEVRVTWLREEQYENA